MASKVILVTGANRGLGFAFIEAIARRSPSDTYLVGARSTDNAEQAIKELQAKGLSSAFHPLKLDVTSDDDISEAVAWVKKTFGRLDVLVNNAAFARKHDSSDAADLRDAFTTTFSVNVTSVAATVSAFEPLLRQSASPRVISISSSRGSMARSSDPKSPPTAVVAYSVSKTALNALGLEMIKSENARAATTTTGSDGGGSGSGGSSSNNAVDGVQNQEGRGSAIAFYLACPGHCRTAFNRFTGPKPPELGARVVVELATAPHGRYESGFWEFGDTRESSPDDEMRMVPW